MTITASAALLAHLAQPYQTTCTLWKVTLTSTTVLGFTDHDQDVTFNDGSGSVTYRAATGFVRTDIEGADDLSVDNMEVDGMLVSPAITEDDLRKGVWDFAAIRVMLVNWGDLTQGCMILRAGRLGQVTIGRAAFVAELRGMAQGYSRTFGELTQPSCRAELGDARCKVVLTPFTVTGTLTGVGSDGLTMLDTSRTEAGPTGTVNITAVTQANPGHVTVSDASALFNGLAITISQAAGMTAINGQTIVRNLSGSGFDLGVDTSGYPAYSGSGKVTPLGETSGYFDFGVMTMTSGPASGYSMEVRSFVPKQWILQLKFAGGLLTPVAGNTYSMKAGCDKSLATCKAKFANVVNMRAEPYLPGIDKLVQIGKQK